MARLWVGKDEDADKERGQESRGIEGSNVKGKERVNVSEFRQTRASPKLSNPLKNTRISLNDEFFKSRRDSLKLTEICRIKGDIHMNGPFFSFSFSDIFSDFLDRSTAMTIEQMRKTATGIRNTCITKTGVKAELVEGMKTGQYPEDHDLQCYAQCVMKTIRTFKNQKVDVDMVTKQIEMMMPIEWQEDMKAAARKCGALEPSDDICVTAFNYVKCNYHENPDNFFFP
ncbi:odorant binding protein 1 [Vespula maculifrons]|uniref:Odorant binding protein 1 n=1 Tax=Vespula maculifrons TaxID=7453 RepID=A0ABD2CLZ8_VESMC